MKIKNTCLYLPGFLLLAVVSCSLDPQVENTFEDDATWSYPDYAEGVLLNAYANIPTRFSSYSSNFLDVATDNAVTNDFGSDIYEVSTGGIRPANNPVGHWSQAYDQFRNIHLFLENGLDEKIIYSLTDDETNAEYRARLKGESFFLRAWWGFRLLQEYGGKSNNGTALGYPIVTRTPTEEELNNVEGISRNTYAECIQQIVADIDTAVVYLPVRYTGSNSVTGSTNLGRADDQVALALKSRVLLYAASPAYQNDDITGIAGMGDFTVLDEATYEAGWVRAAQAAQAALDLIGGVPGLKEGDFNSNNTPEEFIWRKYHNDRTLENQNFPPLNFGNGDTSPSQDLVDAFPAENGYPIDDPRSDYDPGNPYEHRDPRFYLNIMYNGREFLGTPLETYEGGKDTRSVNVNATRTGYYLRKWLALQDLLNVENPTNTHHYHALIRKTEVLLNFAEAANEAWGPTAIGPGTDRSALDAINTIRGNAGITDDSYAAEVAAMGRDAFRKLIQNERRLELAFENHRFFDMRRWLLPLDQGVKGVRIVKAGNGSLTYETFEVEQRGFYDIKDYYLPLPYNEQVKSNLVNNLGW
ncbi:RagB/SusD family nutrient uptake outer membrane protein [Sinomicrobium soli]|uniref:RagB/SusD family nutrient uptake outer membrane protein n=1 Tax=Sinomicrobium sp. N-1-3-6 TaxID=2219864 RepID=UPI0013751AB2|nr:RagB/SusD family nutrient uptake outer membrane protein [Sinomicrobium sp. N-1-3-6]